MEKRNGMNRAIVIGGGIGGLLTARVLSDYYREVLILDRDEFPAEPADRSGVPHGFHPHRFTNRGKDITQELFPGYEKELAALGSPTTEGKKLFMMCQHGTISAPNPQKDMKFSRAALEWVLRERVKQLSSVQLHPGHEVLRLAMSADNTAVTGVEVRERGSGREADLWAADLIVDTSGRGSRLPAWLEGAGRTIPAPDRMKANIGYSTRRYRLPESMRELSEQWDVINIMGQPKNGTYTGVFSFIENQVAEVLLYRPGGQFPPTQPEAFEAAVAGLPTPMIAEITRGLEPVTAPRGYRVPELYRHRYEQVESWPAGLLVLGDACCIFDPIFGQGMTVAAMEAELLNACLQEQGTQLQPGFERTVLQRMQDEIITPAWWLNCAADLRWDGGAYAPGSEPLPGLEFASRFMDLVLKEGMENPEGPCFGLYWGINTLSAPLVSLFNPDRVRAVLEASTEGRELLDELMAEHQGLPLEDVLLRIIPQVRPPAQAHTAEF